MIRDHKSSSFCINFFLMFDELGTTLRVFRDLFGSIRLSLEGKYH